MSNEKAQQNTQGDMYNAQVLIDMFAAYEEARNLHSEQETPSQNVVNLDNESVVDIEHVESARIYPKESRKNTIESTQLNIDEILQTCIIVFRKLRTYVTAVGTAFLVILTRIDDAIVAYLDTLTRKQNNKSVKTKEVPAVVKIPVQSVGGPLVQSVAIRTAPEVVRVSNEKQIRQRDATRLEMILFVCKAVLKKIVIGRYA